MDGDDKEDKEKITEQASVHLAEAAKAINRILPNNSGFILMMTPFPDANAPDAEHRLRYVSNIERESAINLLKEFMIKCSAYEDWMQHL